MPFHSKAQSRFAHANPDKFGGKKGLNEWDADTDWSELPERKKKDAEPTRDKKFTYTPKSSRD